MPVTGTLDADVLAAAAALAARWQRLGEDRLADPVHRVRSAVGARKLIPLAFNRTPFFCSGCPHNTSTVVPDGALVGGGIGCHAMVLLMDPERVGDIVGRHGDGQRGHAVDRHGAVRRARPPHPEHRRRHVLPLGTARGPRRRRRRRQHHLQAALQRRRRDDRRAGIRRAQLAVPELAPAAAARGRAHG